MVNHLHLAIEAAIDSQGVALVSDILAAYAIMSGQLVPLSDRWLASDIILYLVQADHVEMQMSLQDGWRTS